MKNIIKSLVDTILRHDTKDEHYKIISTHMFNGVSCKRDTLFRNLPKKRAEKIAKDWNKMDDESFANIYGNDPEMMKKMSNLRNHYSIELESNAPVSLDNVSYKIVYQESPNAIELTDMPNDMATDGKLLFHHLTKEQAVEVAKQLNSLDEYMYGKKSINPKDPIFYMAVQETK